MSTLKEYVVCLNKDVDYDQFWDEIENESPNDGFVPSRRVDIIDEREGSLRSCHYSLTDDEADLLRKDPRVFCVEIPPDQRDDIVLVPNAIQTGNFNKPNSQETLPGLGLFTKPSEGNLINWGLIRNSSNTNVYGTSLETTNSYTYGYNGTGVDVIISDSGLQVDHPEFKDALGNSRVQQIDWFSASGVAGTQNPNHYRDYDGHGTHVAGTVAGRTYGWAKNSRIYSIKVKGLEGSGDENTGIDLLKTFDVIKLWHRNKPVDPVTGVKRPTVVNMSWGFSGYYIMLKPELGGGGSYRGSTWTGTSFNRAYGHGNEYDSYPTRVDSVDVALEELIDEGIIACVAAGNNDHKIDVPGGPDYNNYIWVWFDYSGVATKSINYYYHRGSSPYSDRALIVGSIRNTPYNATLDRKATFSNAGPGVDIYSAGDQIMSSTSTTNAYPANGPEYTYRSSNYFLDSNYKQLNLSGTSMASPQVAGVAALYLQKNPTATPEQVKTWLLLNSTETMYSTNLNNDYTNNQSLYGGDGFVLYTGIDLLPSEDEPTSTVDVEATTWKIRRLRHLRAYKRLNRILQGI